MSLPAKNDLPHSTPPLQLTPSQGNGVIDTRGEFGTVISTQPLVTEATFLGSATSDLTGFIFVQHRENQLALPTSMFQPVSDTSFSIPFAFDDLIAKNANSGKLHIPLLQEEMLIEKKVVDTGRGLRIEKQTIETPHLIEHQLQQDNLTITHVPQDRFIDDSEVPTMRYEGSTMIIPIMEEVLVVHTRLRLKEEIHITRKSRTVIAKETVLLKSGRVHVERFDESSNSQESRHTHDIAGIESGR